MTRLTVLNSMAGDDLEAALDTHIAWGLRDVDLKDSIFGKGVADLSDDEAARAQGLISSRGLAVYCLSSVLFHHPVESGEAVFEQDLTALDRLLEIAAVLKPELIRLLAPRLEHRDEIPDSGRYLRTRHPWLLRLLTDATDRITEAGFKATIENECVQSILRTPDEVIALFAALDRPDQLVFTWDVQNMWQMGTFPSLEAYEQLRPVLGYYHLKGGQRDGQAPDLKWRSSLEDASWPVLQITRAVVADGDSPVICLNPSHGAPKPGQSTEQLNLIDLTKADIDYVRREVAGID